jgi:hypothetical protein
MLAKQKQLRRTSYRLQRKYHEPTLPTIRMVEEMMKKRQFVNSRNQLFRELPKQVMSQTLNKILNYLEDSNKIILNNDGSIAWIFVESDKVKKILKNSKPFKPLA